MYLPIPSQPSCAKAWLAAANHLLALRPREAFNVVIDVSSPTLETNVDRAIIEEVDRFLQHHKKPPTRSVANTIFPLSTYERHGAPAFYDVYLKKVFPRKAHGDWGRYFERMINLKTGRANESTNPLSNLVDRMREQVHEHDRTFKNIYELAVYDPIRDARRQMNRQCLSFMSFKLDCENRLMLTALYRNHYYIQRLLGNLQGLANLMNFVAKEAKVKVGSLTIVSTHAEVDAIGNRAEVSALLCRCKAKTGLE